MSNSILQTLRFRIIFSIWWFSWAEVHAIILYHYGYTWKTAFIDSSISNILLAGVCVLVSKTFQYYIPKKNAYSYIGTLVIILTLLWLFVARFTTLLFLGNEIEFSDFFQRTILIRAALGLLMIFCMALISVLYYTIRDQQEIEWRKGEAEKLAKEAELFKLRQQLQPHFLFNSLNSINALIVLQPQQARNMIVQLSDFLRGTLKKDDNQWVSLEDELQHLQLYLDIEKVRFGHRLSTNILKSEGTESRLMPAMLLQPIVENAIKFGLYDTTDDITIDISASLVEGNLQIKISNPFEALTSAPGGGTGFGLSSISRRLYLLFARNDLLQTSTENNLFTTTLIIPKI